MKRQYNPNPFLLQPLLRYLFQRVILIVSFSLLGLANILLLLGVEVYDEIVSFEEEEPYDVNRVDSTLKDLIEPDPALYDDTASLWMQFKDEILAPYVSEILGEVETHAAENPTGPNEEQYNEILANYEPGWTPYIIQIPFSCSPFFGTCFKG